MQIKFHCFQCHPSAPSVGPAGFLKFCILQIAGKCIFHCTLKCIARAAHSNQTYNRKIFFECDKPKPSNENRCSARTIIANQIFLANTPTPILKMYHLKQNQCQLPSLLVHWSYQKKTTHAMYSKGGGVHQQGTKNEVCILLELRVNKWYTGDRSLAYDGITQVVSLKSCALFFVLLLAQVKQLNFSKLWRFWRGLNENIVN